MRRTQDWQRYVLADSTVSFSYPPVTPGGQVVEKEEERADLNAEILSTLSVDES